MDTPRFRNRCESVRASLGDYLEGNLSKALRGPFLAHLNRCPDCRRAMEREKELFSLLGGLERHRPPSEFNERVLAEIIPQVRVRRPASSRAVFFSRRLAWAALPMALLILILMIGQIFISPGGDSGLVRETVGRTLVEGGRDISLVLQTYQDLRDKTQSYIEPVLLKNENLSQFERVIRSLLPGSFFALILLVALTPIVLVFTIYRLRIKGALSNVLVCP